MLPLESEAYQMAGFLSDPSDIPWALFYSALIVLVVLAWVYLPA